MTKVPSGEVSSRSGLRYRSNCTAGPSSSNSMQTSVRHGRSRSVCGDMPALCARSLACGSVVTPTYYSWGIALTLQDVHVSLRRCHTSRRPRIGPRMLARRFKEARAECLRNRDQAMSKTRQNLRFESPLRPGRDDSGPGLPAVVSRRAGTSAGARFARLRRTASARNQSGGW